MVQKKFTDKLGIQADSKDYIKSERKAKAIKSYSSQHTDIRNKGGGTELTKKMKKSGTFKLADFEILGSTPGKRGKPRMNMASVNVAVAAVTPEKKPNSIMVSDSSPHYMKSTSSSNAKKERSPVSPYSSSTKTSYEGKNQNGAAGSDHKQVKSLTKTTSLKPVKTLTKTSSLKVMRHLKKSSEIPLNQKQNVCRATCSSTLKDAKFPSFVMTHPEGTESQGPSVMKVCPYTYCSLNGHCHPSLPPLNCFLSARRRLLRSQKITRLKDSSPEVGSKPSGDRNGEIDTGQIHFSAHPEVIEAEADPDFFLEIYSQPRKDTDESIGKNDAKIHVAIVSEVLEDNSYSVKDGEETEPENDGESNAETQPDDSSNFKFEDHLRKDNSFHVQETYLAHSNENGLESGISDESELVESMSEATDMDWEERRVDTRFQDELIFELDGIFSNYSRYVPTNPDEFQVEYEKNIQNFNTRIDDSDHDNKDQMTATSNEAAATKEETGGGAETNGFVHIGISSTSENSLKEPKTSMDICGVYETGNGFLEIQSLASCQVFHEIQQDSHKEANDEGPQAHTDIQVCQFNSLIEVETCGEVSHEDFLATREHSYDDHSDLLDMVENNKLPEKIQCESRHLGISSSAKSEKQNDFESNKIKSCEEITESVEKMQEEASSGTGAAEPFFNINNLAGCEEEQLIINAGIASDQQTSKTSSNLRRPIRFKTVEDEEKLRPFNPREPRYLPVEPGLEKEKVDLRHQMTDERKNAEEWMLDYAIRQAVTKLAPARKKKVALLVEAFETVKPLPNYASHLQQPRPVQACR